MTPDSSDEPRDARRALLVGIDTYRGAPLRGCRQDAEDVSACLSLPGFDFDCQTLVDGDATRLNILGRMGELAYANDGEILLFYFSGHGLALGDHGHLLTVDGVAYDPGVSLTHLAQLMDSASNNYRHVIAILDSCHAGAMPGWVGSRPIQSRDFDRVLKSPNDSKIVMAACRAEESSWQGEGGSYYTNLLIDGMLGDAVDFNGEVRLLALHDYVAHAIPDMVQTPVFKGDLAGVIAIGRGFPPRLGKPLAADQMKRTLEKGRALLDEYYNLSQYEMGDIERRRAGGSQECSRRLASVVEWFRDTEVSLSDLPRAAEWKALRERLLDYRGQLAHLSIGERIADLTVISLLGDGGFGRVWKVESPESGKAFALKVFHAHDMSDAVKVQRFRNGFSNMGKLEHPSIVRVHSLVETPFGVLMDYVDGLDLEKTYLDRSDIANILRVLLEICETVEHAHGRGVLHRDIKPANVIMALDESGVDYHPVLTDFDLAYHSTNRTLTLASRAVGGAPSYAAPEQLFRPDTDAARAATVDVFGLAQLMFFLITGRDPIAEASDANMRILGKHLNDWMEGRAASKILDLYQVCSYNDPAARPQAVLEVIDAVGEALAFVQAASGGDEIEESAFCQRLAHQYSGVRGFVSSESSCTMASLSQQLSIIVRIKGSGKAPNSVNLEIEMNAVGHIPIAAFSSGQAARQAINSRLDKAMSRFRANQVSRHPGSRGVFQTFVEVKGLPLTVAGLASAKEVLAAATAAIEQW